ncbi:MAG: crossover junction endodeoxyribonuclease RuvC [Lentisphaeria bacterium]|nr:crossover junction endodeoxyribonuclease RuvC [Lentisphaeria bacterium]
MRILGVDTALRCTGYGLIDVENRSYNVVDCGIIKNSLKASYSNCLFRLSSGIDQLINEYDPDLASIEGAFYLKNAKTAMLLGMARGAVVASLSKANITIYEYAPTRAKQAITGFGRAGKEQVAQVLSGMLSLDVSTIPDDATDALSLAVCHAVIADNQNGIHLKDPI